MRRQIFCSIVLDPAGSRPAYLMLCLELTVVQIYLQRRKKFYALFVFEVWKVEDEFTQLVIKGLAAQSQQFGGARDIAAVPCHRFED